MTKMKTKKSASKRFRVGGKGRLIRGQAKLRHNTGKRRPGQTHKLRKMLTVDKSDEGLVSAVLPYRRKQAGR